MDKNTLSNYGWIVIAVLVLAVMIALATPFGRYIENGVRSTTAGLFETSEKALNVVGMTAGEGNFEDGYGEASTTILPAKGKTLEQYSWEEVRDIIAAGKATEYGFAVGQTKTLTMMTQKEPESSTWENMTQTATIIGLNHDDENTATFMIVSSGGIGNHVMNTDFTNAGGWEASEMRKWLNEDIYNSMSNKGCIKEVTKMTNNVGYEGTTATSTSDKVFLPSLKEAGVMDELWSWYYPEECITVLETEGTAYTWFESNTVGSWFWLRSPLPDSDGGFFGYHYGSLYGNDAYWDYTVCPAFVIG